MFFRATVITASQIFLQNSPFHDFYKEITSLRNDSNNTKKKRKRSRQWTKLHISWEIRFPTIKWHLNKNRIINKIAMYWSCIYSILKSDAPFSSDIVSAWSISFRDASHNCCSSPSFLNSTRPCSTVENKTKNSKLKNDIENMFIYLTLSLLSFNLSCHA